MVSKKFSVNTCNARHELELLRTLCEKNNWENIAYTWETGGKKVPNSISSVDAEEFLNDLDI